MFVNQKAQQISYALLRISAYIRRSELRNRLEKLSFELLESVSARKLDKIVDDIEVLKGLIGLGKEIYEIEPINAKIIIDELESLNSAINKVDIASVFSHSDNDSVYSGANGSGNGNGNGNGNGIGSTIRQSAIIEKIRQSGNTAMKDLIAEFPDVSERTLRYDLQKLCNQGIIERIGNGGPSSYYVLSKITQ